MKRIILGIYCCILGYWAMAQPKAKLSKSNYHFGSVKKWKNPPALFPVKNTGNADLVFLPTFPKRDILVLLPQKPIPPGESATISIQYYTPQTGPFDRRIEIYSNAGARPIVLSITGNIVSLDQEADIACPDVGPKDNIRRQVRAFDQKILVVDKTTGIPVPGADIRIVEQEKQQTFKTGSGGMADCELDLGMIELYVSRSGYEPVHKSGYINKNTGLLTIELLPSPEEQPTDFVVHTPNEPDHPPEPEPADPEPTPADPPVAVKTSETAEDKDPPIPVEAPGSTPQAPDPEPVDPVPAVTENPNKEEPELELPAADPEPPPDIIDGRLSPVRFHPNNIVFLIDVSTSMRPEDKLPLLKKSMKQLAAILRPVDRITLITYATGTKIVLPTTTADQKDSICLIIDSLQAKGVTNGVRGLNLAYEVAAAHFLPSGNNQILLATDGLFKDPYFSEKDLMNQIKSQAAQRIKLSVIGYGDDKVAIKRMHKMAYNGQGQYLQVRSENDDSTVLIDEIKTNSRKF